MKKHLVKNGKRVIGFVSEYAGKFTFAFGKPSQREYIAFDCNSLEHGIECINKYYGVN